MGSTSDSLIFYFIFLFNLTYSRWASSLPSCLWSLRIFPSLPGSRLTIFYRDASSALLQLVTQWLNFIYSRSSAFRYYEERKNTNPTLVRIELTTSALAGVQFTYKTTRVSVACNSESEIVGALHTVLEAVVRTQRHCLDTDKLLMFSVG